MGYKNTKFSLITISFEFIWYFSGTHSLSCTVIALELTLQPKPWNRISHLNTNFFTLHFKPLDDKDEIHKVIDRTRERWCVRVRIGRVVVCCACVFLRVYEYMCVVRACIYINGWGRDFVSYPEPETKDISWQTSQTCNIYTMYMSRIKGKRGDKEWKKEEDVGVERLLPSLTEFRFQCVWYLRTIIPGVCETQGSSWSQWQWLLFTAFVMFHRPLRLTVTFDPHPPTYTVVRFISY